MHAPAPALLEELGWPSLQRSWTLVQAPCYLPLSMYGFGAAIHVWVRNNLVGDIEAAAALTIVELGGRSSSCLQDAEPYAATCLTATVLHGVAVR